MVPPWEELPPEPDFLPPRLDAPGELAILAARSFDIPLSFRASYCFSFFTFARFSGTETSSWMPVIFPSLQARNPHGSGG